MSLTVLAFPKEAEQTTLNSEIEREPYHHNLKLLRSWNLLLAALLRNTAPIVSHKKFYNFSLTLV